MPFGQSKGMAPPCPVVPEHCENPTTITGLQQFSKDFANTHCFTSLHVGDRPLTVGTGVSSRVAGLDTGIMTPHFTADHSR